MNIYIIVFLVILICVIYPLCTMPSKTVWIYKHLTEKDMKIIEKKILSYDGREFEVFCSNLFTMKGYNCELTQQTNDGGKDLILDKKIYVELKAWNDKPIGRPEIQKLIGACLASNIQECYFICTGTYNKNALEYAKQINKTGNIKITLYYLDDLLTWIKEIDNDEVVTMMGLPSRLQYKNV
jgi:HJR/Mrr/RecB family endonuclease